MMANARPARERERLNQQRLLSAVGELDLTRNLSAQFVALVTLLTEIFAVYRADGCDRVRLYVRRLDDPDNE